MGLGEKNKCSTVGKESFKSGGRKVSFAEALMGTDQKPAGPTKKKGGTGVINKPGIHFGIGDRLSLKTREEEARSNRGGMWLEKREGKERPTTSALEFYVQR